jgi:peptide chain release factor
MTGPFRMNTIFGVTARKEESLRNRMSALGISESDLEEIFIRSGKKGGQHVNKTSTCVYLRHIPTGIEVKCQVERSQSLNRFFARRLITDKVESMLVGRESAELRRIEKIRRQKRKRSKRSREKMLRLKRINSEKKALRRVPAAE